MDLESRRRIGQKSSMGNDVQHGEENGRRETKNTLEECREIFEIVGKMIAR